MGQMRDQFQATVAANLPLCREHFRLVLRLARFPATDPGQFVQVACRDLGSGYREPAVYDWNPGETNLDHPSSRLAAVPEGRVWLSNAKSVPSRQPLNEEFFSDPDLNGRLAMLRRPFSLAGRRDLPDGVEIELIHRVVGVGTDWLSHLKAGDSVFVLGPLGNRFQLPPDDGVALMVGGGAGIPPMMYLASRLVGKKAVGFSGALTRELLPLTITDDALPPQPYDVDPLYNIAEFSRFGIPAVIATDDGSYGFRGFVTQALEAYLTKFFSNKKSAVIYTCGPEPMMKRVADIAEKFGLPCQIAVERAMACGMGTCQSCCIKVKKSNPELPPLPGKEWAYRLACTDGPVFMAADLLW